MASPRLGPGVNLGGVFDRRDGGPFDWPTRGRDLAAIRDAGFASVRLPVRWWGRGGADGRVVDERDLAVVTEAAAAVAEHGLSVVLSMHHADGVMSGAAGAEDRLCGLWRAVASSEWPEETALDLLNEPHGHLTPSRWDDLAARLVEVVREVDRTRTLVVSGALQGTVEGLRALHPPDDPDLVVTLHYYEPFAFTHQGASWLPGSQDWLGRGWGSEEERAAVAADLAAARSWADAHELPLYVGELGAVSAAGRVSREAWTRCVREVLDELDVPWACWELRGDFGLLDDAGSWRRDLLDALLPSR